MPSVVYPDPRISSLPVSIRQVTSRTGIFNQKSGSNTTSGWRAWQISHVPITALKIGIWNGFVGSATSGVETGTGSTMTVYLSVEYPKGTFTRITAQNGGNFNTIADNAIGFSDLFQLPFTIPAYAWFRINGYFSMAAGGTVPTLGWSNICDRGNGDEYQVGTGTDNTLNGTVLGAGFAQSVLPQLVLAQSERGVWGIIGDSLAAGVSDLIFDPAGGRGLLGRELAQFGPHLNYGVPGDRAVWAAASYTKRQQLLQAGGVTGAILQLGTNDFYSGGRNSAQLLTDRATLRGLLPGVTIFDTTVTPASTSTDNFRTAANQTIAGATSNTNRVTFNDALRNGQITGSSGPIDVAAYVETSTAYENGPVINGGIWIPRFMTNGDGIHPNTTAAEEIAPSMQRMLASRR